MRRSYTIRQKLEILEEQTRERISNSEICRRHSLTLQQLKNWRESRNEMLVTSRRKRSLHIGNPSIYTHHVEALKDYILERRRTMSIVTIRSFIDRLHELEPASVAKSFNSKRTWTYRFLQRSGFSIRRVTRAITLSDETMRSRFTQFYSEIERRYQSNRSTVFLNMDQTGLLYGTIGRTTIELTGTRSVPIRTMERQTDRITLALTVSSSGDKLRPFAIFKGTTSGRVNREFSRRENPYPQDIEYATSENAWMTRQLMMDWMDTVLFPYTETIGPQNICLLLDSFRVHQEAEIISRLTTAGIETIFIPGGLTADLQPLDVGVNAPFKHYIRENSVNTPNFTNLSAQEKRFILAGTISRAWNAITRDTIVNSFNRALITTLDDMEEIDEVVE
jgi:hypothetical protein